MRHSRPYVEGRSVRGHWTYGLAAIVSFTISFGTGLLIGYFAMIFPFPVVTDVLSALLFTVFALGILTCAGFAVMSALFGTDNLDKWRNGVRS